MLKSKHVIAALIITPLLSIGGYFLVDATVGEKPHVAEKGHSYPLVALPNCRYASGKCTLKNNDFKVELTSDGPGVGMLQVHLTANVALQGAKMALVQDQAQTGEPVVMRSSDSTAKLWQVALQGTATETSQLRLVLVADDAFYFGETSLGFLQGGSP